MSSNYSYPLLRIRNPDIQPTTVDEPPLPNASTDRRYASSRSTAKPTAKPPPTAYTLPSTLPSGIPFSITRSLLPVTHVAGHVRKDSRFDDAAEIECAVPMVREGKAEPREVLTAPSAPTTRRALGSVINNVPRSNQSIKPSLRTYALNTHAESPRRKEHTPDRLRKANPTSPESIRPRDTRAAETRTRKTGTEPQIKEQPLSISRGDPPPYEVFRGVKGSRIPVPVARGVEEVVAPAMPFSSGLVEGSRAKGPIGVPPPRKENGRMKQGRKPDDASSSVHIESGRSPRDQQEAPAVVVGPVITKKKSLMGFASALKPKPAEGRKFNGLVRGIGRRKKHGPDTAATDPTSSIPDSTDNPGDESVVSDCLPVRQSTESDSSIMSDWTIADASEASFGLPADTELAQQYGGVHGGDGRSIRKKKSFAAAGVLLSKILHGPAKERGREGNEDVGKKLRHEESTATLRPKKTNASRPASPAASIASFESKHPSQHDTSHASAARSGRPWERSKSPELPTFHFTRPSYSGTNFRADLGVGEEVPPVPALPVVFLSRASTTRTDAKGSSDMPVVDRNGNTSSTREPAVLQSTQTEAESSQSPDESGGSSLVHVEHALDLSGEYSLISAGTDGRRHSGKLPWRRSVQGVFVWKGENEARREGEGFALHSAEGLGKRPSLMDLKKVSHVTGTLQDFINDYPASPSTLNERAMSPLGDESCNPVDAMMHSLSVKLASPSSSNIMEQDSPTPLRKFVHHPYTRSGKSGSRHGGSPVKVSPLRLALGNNAAKVSQSDAMGNDFSPSQRIFDDNPFLSAKKPASSRSAVPAGRLNFELKTSARTFNVDAMSDAASCYSDEAPFNHEQPVHKPTILMPMPMSLRARGCSTNTEATASSADQDDQIRESFDFTGEYRALTENGTRQSFVDELGRFGLSVGEASFELGNVATGSDGGSIAHQELTNNRSDARARDLTSPGVAKRNSYGFNKDFKFGTSPAAQPAATKAAVSDRSNADTFQSPPSPPRDPLPVPEGSPRFQGRFRFKQNGPEDSMFSIASMSSVGPVVDTGIAGMKFVNIFDRDFGAAVDGKKDVSISSINLGSSTQSKDLAPDHSRPHLRKPSHARVPSFASITSRNGSVRSNAIIAQHKRQESSLDSNQSVLRHLGRPTVNGDRMFETDNRAHRLYSIESSPGKSMPNRTLIKYSKDSLLDSSRHISTNHSIPNSLPEINEDSIFQSGAGKPKATHFAIKSVDDLARVIDEPGTVVSVSPLALKSKKSSRMSPVRMDSLEYHKRHSKDSHHDVADIDRYPLQSNAEEASADASFRSNSSFRAGGSRKTQKPARCPQSRPSSFLLANTEIPALSPLARSEVSSRLSTDEHSIISAMLDPETGSSKRWSRRLKGLSLLSEHAPVIAEEATQVSIAIDTSSAPSYSSAGIVSETKPPGLLKKWVGWQRVAEQELTKSRMTWEDTKQSIQDVADFKPPTTAKEVKVLLRNSLDLNQPLSEVSPGTQVTRRELFPLGKSGKVEKTTIGSQGSANRLSLPTKYMRADSSSSAAASRNNCEDKSDSQTRPVSLVFAKFATPVNPENKNSGTAIASLAPKHVNVLPRKKEVLLAKQASGGRQRDTSAVRREKMGWSRRKEVPALSPAAMRLASRQSRKLTSVADKENFAPSQSTKKRVPSYKPVRKASHKGMRA